MIFKKDYYIFYQPYSRECGLIRKILAFLSASYRASRSKKILTKNAICTKILKSDKLAIPTFYIAFKRTDVNKTKSFEIKYNFGARGKYFFSRK